MKKHILLTLSLILTIFSCKISSDYTGQYRLNLGYSQLEVTAARDLEFHKRIGKWDGAITIEGESLDENILLNNVESLGGLYEFEMNNISDNNSYLSFLRIGDGKASLSIYYPESIGKHYIGSVDYSITDEQIHINSSVLVFEGESIKISGTLSAPLISLKKGEKYSFNADGGFYFESGLVSIKILSASAITYYSSHFEIPPSRSFYEPFLEGSDLILRNNKQSLNLRLDGNQIFDREIVYLQLDGNQRLNPDLHYNSRGVVLFYMLEANKLTYEDFSEIAFLKTFIKEER